MEVHEPGDVEMAVRTALKASEILAGYKKLLGLYATDFSEGGWDFSYLRECLLAKPAISEAQAMIAYLEGTVSPKEPIYGWPTRCSFTGLTAQEHNALEGAGIATVGDLLRYSPQELIVIKGFGDRGVWVVEYALEQTTDMRLAKSKASPPEDSLLFRMSYHAVLRDEPRSLAEAFDAAGIKTVRDLVEWTAEDLESLRGIGPLSIACIEEGLEHFGLKLADELAEVVAV